MKRSFDQTKTLKPPDITPYTSPSDQGPSGLDDVTRHHRAFRGTSPSQEEQVAGILLSFKPPDSEPTKENAYIAYQRAIHAGDLKAFKQKEEQWKLALEYAKEMKQEERRRKKSRVEYTNYLLRQNFMEDKVTQRTSANDILARVNDIRGKNQEEILDFDGLDKLAREYMEETARKYPDVSGLTVPTEAMKQAYTEYTHTVNNKSMLAEFKHNEKKWREYQQCRSITDRRKTTTSNYLRENRIGYINNRGKGIDGYENIPKQANKETALKTINDIIRSHQPKPKEPLTWERLKKKAQKFGENEQYVDTSDADEPMEDSDEEE